MWKKDLFRILSSSEPDLSGLKEVFIEKSRALPKALFKYRAVNKYALRNLEEDAVWLADPTQFNDPYDSALGVAIERLLEHSRRSAAHQIAEYATLTNVLSPSEVREVADIPDSLDQLTRTILGKYPSFSPEKLKDLLTTLHGFLLRFHTQLVDRTSAQIRSTLKLCSFSEIKDSILMWSHYADCHRGFCIEYPINHLPQQDIRRRLLFPAIYSDSLFDSTDLFERMIAGERFNNLFAVAVCLLKAQEWSYEREWRLVIAGNVFQESTSYLMPTPTAIYLGAKITIENREALLQRV